MYRSILLPLDGSTFAESALPAAAAIARQSGAVLRVTRVHVPAAELQPTHAPSHILVTAEAEPAVHRDATESGSESEYLAAIAADITGTGVHATTQVLDGPFVGSLVSYADSIDADLVVIATHARGLLARAWTDSIARGLVKQSSRPCLLVRPGRDHAQTDAHELFQHVLIPLDGSPASEQVVPHAVSLGALGDARYTLLHVLTPTTLVGYAGSPGVGALNWSEVEERSAEAMLERTAARLRLRSLDVTNAVIRCAHVAQAIGAYAVAHEVDLVAMATHGSGLSRLALGVVADRVTRESPVPVLLFRPAR